MELDARRANVADAALLWRWANDPETRRRSFTKTAIPWDDHVAWLGKRLASDRAAIWIFSDGAEPVGQVRADVDDDAADVSIVVAPEHRGRGCGKAMLAAGVRLLRQDFGRNIAVRALVLDDNATSLRIFTACGFRAVGPAPRPDGQRATVLELHEPADDRAGGASGSGRRATGEIEMRRRS